MKYVTPAFSPPIKQLLVEIGPSSQNPLYAPPDNSELVKASALYQANVAPVNEVSGVHFTDINPLLSMLALISLGARPALPGEIGFAALGAPRPALLLATTST
jgi:hypothetical protein